MRCSTPSRALASSRGYSLLELLTAFAVLSMGVFGALQLHSRSMEGLHAIEEDRACLEVLSNALERVRAVGHAPAASGEVVSIGQEDSRFARLHQAEAWLRVEEATVPGLVTLYAEARWIGERGRLRERSIVTLAPAAQPGSSIHE